MRKSAPLFRTLPAVLILAAAIAGSRPASAQGVTLFRERFLHGPSQTFHDDVPDLRYTQFGSRRASSVYVPPGCVAVLFDQPGFHGRRTEFRDSDNDLSNTAVGEDAASSLRVNCRHDGPETHYHPDWHVDHPSPSAPTRGAVLYRDREGRGPNGTCRTSTARALAAAWRARSTSRRAASRSSTSFPVSAAGTRSSAKETTTSGTPPSARTRPRHSRSAAADQAAGTSR